MSGRTGEETRKRMQETLEEASARVEANWEWADAVKANWQKTLDNKAEARKRAMDAEERG
ncbi:hypothetical protein [Gluconobacter sp. P1C6_b]|uniref:hypothetical protein n=1 Tax=Gluconobacter sp. P1C6_b TaxID=2762619 RepID=UPI001C05A4B2|nr:hypothetical protein [Gluconobacter sp. P1C6_b]